MLYDRLPKKINKIFIDLDDTLVDFIGEAASLLGIREVSTEQDKKKLCEIVFSEGMQPELWARINKAGPEWWASLPKLPWADELWKVANQACDDVIILTSPGRHTGAETAAMGKVMWSLKQFKDNYVMLAYRKYMCSHPGALLIDDWDKFTVPWEKRGGTAIQLYREWNSKGYTYDEIIEALNRYAAFNRR
jgi:hypothetical protein